MNTADKTMARKKKQYEKEMQHLKDILDHKTMTSAEWHKEEEQAGVL